MNPICRLSIGNLVIKDAAYPRAFLRMHLNLVIIELLGRCKKVRVVDTCFKSYSTDMILETREACYIFRISLHEKLMEILILKQLQATVSGQNMRLQLLMNVRIRFLMIMDK